MNPGTVDPAMAEAVLLRREAPRPKGPTVPSPAGPGLPEPPAYRAHPLAPPGACVNCGGRVAGRYSVPRCWECSRALCLDCYWKHGLAPADHRCAACRARSPPRAASVAISGGRPAPPRPTAAATAAHR